MTDLADEDAIRASLYALLARLFHDRPDEALLRRMAAAGDMPSASGPLAEAWLALTRACAVAGDETGNEFEDLFLGPGQAPVTLYLSHYWTPALRQSTLVNLRQDLTRLGAQRNPGTFEPEDHAAALFDLMRLLISKSSGARSSDAEAWVAQQHVFSRYIAPARAAWCDAISRHPAARFYRLVASLCAAFLDLETQALGVLP